MFGIFETTSQNAKRQCCKKYCARNTSCESKKTRQTDDNTRPFTGSQSPASFVEGSRCLPGILQWLPTVSCHRTLLSTWHSQKDPRQPTQRENMSRLIFVRRTDKRNSTPDIETTNWPYTISCEQQHKHHFVCLFHAVYKLTIQRCTQISVSAFTVHP